MFLYRSEILLFSILSSQNLHTFILPHLFSISIFSFIRIVQQTVLGAANIDGGVYSEPIMYLKMILEWHGTKPSEQEEWASKHGIIRYWIILYCIVLYCTVLSHIISHCIVYYCIVQYSIVLYCIVLYCIVLY